MENENKNEDNQGASTSKKETKERKDDEYYEDGDRDDRSYTETTASDYSARSHVELRKDGRPEQPKLVLGKREAKPPERKKRVRRGRVAKRKRSTPRKYQPLRRGPKRKPRAEKRTTERNGSVSTIFTRLSSRSASDARSCTYCGHRCCYRRSYCSERDFRKSHVRRITKELRKWRYLEARGALRSSPFKKETRKRKVARVRRVPPERGGGRVPPERGHKVSGLESIQTGSKSKMLSKLFVGTNAKLADANDTLYNFVSITPDMIYEALKKLTMWRQMVPLDAILENMKSTYPVNRNDDELAEELAEKLRIATAAGMVTEAIKDGVSHWCLTNELQNRGLTKNHVTMFWKIYSDTMSPIKKRTERSVLTADVEKFQSRQVSISRRKRRPARDGVKKSKYTSQRKKFTKRTSKKVYCQSWKQNEKDWGKIARM